MLTFWLEETMNTHTNKIGQVMISAVKENKSEYRVAVSNLPKISELKRGRTWA